MGKRKSYGLLGLIIVMVFITTACAKGFKSDVADTATASNNFSVNYDTAMNTGADFVTEQDAPAASTDTQDKGTGLGSTAAVPAGSNAMITQDKIIRTFILDVETQEFDSLITDINSEISRLGGYVESSQVSGKRYYNENNTRFGSIKARIPSNKADEFVNTVNGVANVVNKQETTENVSLQYIDTQSRVDTLKIEQERLYAILEKEVNLDNIITLESRLSDIRYELQNYESQLRYYDNQVAYSTITMSIQEVDKLTPVTVKKQTVGTRIKNGFSNSMYKISEGFKNFFVWFIVNLPYLLIWAVIIALAVYFVRKYMKKKKTGNTIPNTNPENQNLNKPNQ